MFKMRTYLIVLSLVFAAGLAFAWTWGLDHRLNYLSRDYALLTGKNRLIDGYSRPGLAIFGDSVVMDGVLPEKLGPGVVNLALNGCTPIESYFMVRRLLRAPAQPRAVLLSYSAYHFVHPDFYWENTVKFGVISGPEADEVMGRIIAMKDKELITGSGLWNLDQRLYSFLLSRGFPSYYMSSLFAETYGVREKENLEALKVIAQTRGQYYFPLADGSKELNADTQLKTFNVDPVIDYYFRETLNLLRKENILAYFYAMPTNESSVPHLDPGVFHAYQDYLEGLASQDDQFHILSKLREVYPWRLFSDHAHLNLKGTARFNKEFAQILNQARVPGGPYGISIR
jgi:hypothetical protein